MVGINTSNEAVDTPQTNVDWAQVSQDQIDGVQRLLESLKWVYDLDDDENVQLPHAVANALPWLNQRFPDEGRNQGTFKQKNFHLLSNDTPPKEFHLYPDRIEFADNSNNFEPQDAIEMVMLAATNPKWANNKMELTGSPQEVALLVLACEEYNIEFTDASQNIINALNSEEFNAIASTFEAAKRDINLDIKAAASPQYAADQLDAEEDLNGLLETLVSIETRLEDDFEGYELVIVPDLSNGAQTTQAERDVLDRYHNNYLTNYLAKSELSDESKAAIADKYKDFKQGVGEGGSIACMAGLELDDTSIDFVGICMKQTSGRERILGDGSLDRIFITLHEIGHTLHSKYYGGDDDDRFNAAQKEVFADAFACYYIKHELGIDGAYEDTAAWRKEIDDKEYPFHEHAEDLESKMSALHDSETVIQDVMQDLANYVEHNPALKTLAVEAANDFGVPSDALPHTEPPQLDGGFNNAAYTTTKTGITATTYNDGELRLEHDNHPVEPFNIANRLTPQSAETHERNSGGALPLKTAAAPEKNF